MVTFVLPGGWARAGQCVRRAAAQCSGAARCWHSPRMPSRPGPGREQRTLLAQQHPGSPRRLPSLAAAANGDGAEALTPYDEARMRRAPPSPDNTAFTVLSWNVAGLRALLKKDPLAISRLISDEKPDVICLQETKLQTKNVDGIQTALQLGELGYSAHWNCAVPPSRLGYSGVAMFVRSELSNSGTVTTAKVHKDVDCEGRTLVAEFPDLYVVCVYTPNAGAGLKRLDYRVDVWDAQFSRLLQELGKEKPVLVTGDLNVAHQNIDIHSPSTNQRSAGFTQEERSSFANNLLGNGFVDVFRAQHPDVVAYTYWSYRANSRTRNRGWRLDYTLVSSDLVKRCHDAFLLPGIAGSDHCPIGLVLSSKAVDDGEAVGGDTRTAM